jgi:hypothetical protein
MLQKMGIVYNFTQPSSRALSCAIPRAQEEPMDAQVKVQRLESWLESRGVVIKKDLVSLQAGIRGTGCAFGVVAAQDLVKEQSGTTQHHNITQHNTTSHNITQHHITQHHPTSPNITQHHAPQRSNRKM